MTASRRLKRASSCTSTVCMLLAYDTGYLASAAATSKLRRHRGHTQVTQVSNTQ